MMCLLFLGLVFSSPVSAESGKVRAVVRSLIIGDGIFHVYLVGHPTEGVCDSDGGFTLDINHPRFQDFRRFLGTSMRSETMVEIAYNGCETYTDPYFPDRVSTLLVISSITPSS